MAFLKFGQEGEAVPNQVTPVTSYADVNNRGGSPFKVGEFSRVTFGTQADVWWHGKCVVPYTVDAGSSAPNTYEFFSIRDSAGQALITAFGYGGNGFSPNKMAISGIANDTTTLTVMYDYTAPPTTGSPIVFDFHATLTGTTMVIEAYVNGSLLTSRTIVGTTPTWGQPAIGSYGNFGKGTGNTVWWEIIASTTPTVGTTLSTLEATSAGFHTAGAGTYSDITGNGVDLATSVSLVNIGDKESWIISPLAGKTLGSTSVKNITLSALVTHNGGAVTGYRYFIRSGGVDYPTAGGTIIPTQLINNYVEEVSINPATAAPFTAAELTAGIEVGIEAV